MTTEEIYAAGAAAVAGFPPLDEPVLNQLAAILAPLAGPQPTEPVRMKKQPRPARPEAA